VGRGFLWCYFCGFCVFPPLLSLLLFTFVEPPWVNRNFDPLTLRGTSAAQRLRLVVLGAPALGRAETPAPRERRARPRSDALRRPEITIRLGVQTTAAALSNHSARCVSSRLPTGLPRPPHSRPTIPRAGRRCCSATTRPRARSSAGPLARSDRSRPAQRRSGNENYPALATRPSDYVLAGRLRCDDPPQSRPLSRAARETTSAAALWARPSAALAARRCSSLLGPSHSAALLALFPLHLDEEPTRSSRAIGASRPLRCGDVIVRGETRSSSSAPACLRDPATRSASRCLPCAYAGRKLLACACLPTRILLGDDHIAAGRISGLASLRRAPNRPDTGANATISSITIRAPATGPRSLWEGDAFETRRRATLALRCAPTGRLDGARSCARFLASRAPSGRTRRRPHDNRRAYA